MTAMRKFISATKQQLLAWTPVGNTESHRSYPKIGGNTLEWKVVMEVPDEHDRDFMELWELWLVVEELAPTKGRIWNWVACSEAEWQDAFACIVPLLGGAARDAAALRDVAVMPSLEKLNVRDTLTASYRNMLQVAERAGSRCSLVAMLRNRLLVAMLKQAKSGGRRRMRKPARRASVRSAS